MLFSYKTLVKASAYHDEYKSKNIADENVKTFCIAEKNGDK
jgi:hypothetical protein